MARSRFATYGLPALATAALLFGIWSVARREVSQPLEEPVVEPPTPPPSMPASIGAVGLVEAASEQIAVAPQVAGVATSVRVVAGDKVRAGDVLFTLDDRAARADLDQRQADLAVARAQLAEADANAADLDDQRDRADRLAEISAGVSISEDTLLRRRYAAASADARVVTARAGVASAESAVRRAQVDLDLLTVRAPIDATVLQTNIRAGEMAPATQLSTPLIVLGSLTPLNIRVDIDEAEIPHFDPAAPAFASPRGAAEQRVPLKLVRVDPLVVPKVSLTGAGAERVDTRVLRAVYAFDPTQLRAYPGQQMDVFIGLPAGASAH